ncbi:hypothetical protein HK096_001171, partial [Nowakowskiella sp. JEL0078]
TVSGLHLSEKTGAMYHATSNSPSAHDPIAVKCFKKFGLYWMAARLQNAEVEFAAMSLLSIQHVGTQGIGGSSIFTGS